MDEDYRWKLKALAHDAREMRAAKAEGYESFGGVYPYICGLTYHDQLCLPKLHWGRKVPELPLRELSQGRLLPPSPPKTLCEEAYRTVSHLNIRHALQLDPLLDDPCEAWFKKVLPYVLGEKKAPPQPSPWKAVTLDEQHLQALEATADALDILSEQLYAGAAASDRAGQNTSAEAEPIAGESGEDEPKAGESAEAEPTASESGEDEPTVGESGEAEPTVASDSVGQNTDSDASENAKPAPPTRRQKQILDILRSLDPEDTRTSNEIADQFARQFQKQTDKTLEGTQVIKEIGKLRKKGYNIVNVRGGGYYLLE